jgi:hypothetical protein
MRALEGMKHEPTTTFGGRMTRKRYDAGLTARDAAHDIALGDYDSRGDAERITANVATLCREFAGNPTAPNPAELFALIGVIWRKRRSQSQRFVAEVNAMRVLGKPLFPRVLSVLGVSARK